MYENHYLKKKHKKPSNKFFFYQNKGEKKNKGDKEGDNKLFINKKIIKN